MLKLYFRAFFCDSNFKQLFLLGKITPSQIKHCFGCIVISACSKEIWEAPMKLGIFLNIAMHCACVTLRCIGIRICDRLLMCLWNNTLKCFDYNFSAQKIWFSEKTFKICFDVNTKIPSFVLNFHNCVFYSLTTLKGKYISRYLKWWKISSRNMNLGTKNNSVQLRGMIL